MIPWEVISRARAPDGGELVLYRRDDEFVIRVDGRELMSSRAHGSEERLAHLACAGLAGRAAPRVLVGGLGLGYTLRATLDALPAGAGAVVVAEIVGAVVDWNRGPLAALTGRPLDDPRVAVEVADIGTLLRRAGPRWDAVLLDVDNGPAGLTRPANQILYGEQGLAAIRRALRPAGGCLAVWSAAPDPSFARRLGRAGFVASTHQVPARGSGGGPEHTIFIGRLPVP